MADHKRTNQGSTGNETGRNPSQRQVTTEQRAQRNAGGPRRGDAGGFGSEALTNDDDLGVEEGEQSKEAGDRESSSSARSRGRS